MQIHAVVFDLGETLVDETRMWGEWADWIGVPRLTLFGVLGGVIAAGEDHRRTFDIIRPGFDHARASAERAAVGQPSTFVLDDFYPDALPCLAEIKRAGLRIGISGNQPDWAVPMLRAMHLGLDVVGSSGAWGVAKPDLRFFARMAAELDLRPAEIAYVGDRIDNDVSPAIASGMTGVFLRRGPWAYIQERTLGVPPGAIVIDALTDLPGALRLADAPKPGTPA